MSIQAQNFDDLLSDTPPQFNPKNQTPYVYQLNNLVVRGNNALPSQTFSEIYKSYLDRPLTLSELSRMMQEIEDIYKKFGVETVKIKLPLDNTNATSMDIRIEEPEGISPEFILKTLEIKGANLLTQEDFDPIISSYLGQTVKLENIIFLRESIYNLYTEKGFSRPSAPLPVISPEEGLISFTLHENDADWLKVAEEQLLNEAPAKKEIKPTPNKLPSPEAKTLVEIERGIFLLTPERLAKAIQMNEPKFTPRQGWQRIDRGIYTMTNNHIASLKENELITFEVINPVRKPSPPPMQTVFPAPSKVIEKTKNKRGLEVVIRPEEDSLLLELFVNNTLITPTLLAYVYSEKELILPLGEIARALSSDVITDVESGVSQGKLLPGQVPFYLNIGLKHLVLNGENSPFPEEGVEIQGEDIFVRQTYLEDWFGLKLSFDHGLQRLSLSTEEELPFEWYAKRRNLWEQVKGNNPPEIAIDEPRYKVPYRKFSAPSLRVTASHTNLEDSNGNSSRQSTVNLQSLSDLAGMSADINATYVRSETKDNLQDVRATLSRVNPEGKMLGSMHATQVALGDITLPPVPLISDTRRGRGAYISSQPIGYVHDPDNFNIYGSAPVGWDVEIYQNDILLDFQTVSTDGRYAFDTLPLRSGLNIFNIELYGPAGEHESLTEQYYLGPGMVKPGKLHYDMAFTESSDPLIDLTGNKDDSSSAMLRTEYGINRNLSLLTGIYSGPFSLDNGQAGTLGVRAAYGSFFADMNYMRRADDASAYTLALRDKIVADINVAAGYEHYSGFDSSEKSELDKAFVRLEDYLEIPKMPLINFFMELSRSNFKDGHTENSLLSRFSTRIKDFFISHESNQVIYEGTSLSDTTNSTLAVSKNLNNWDTRAKLGYKTGSGAGVQSLDLRASSNLSSDMGAQVTVNRQFSGKDTTRVDGVLTWKLRSMDLALSGGKSSDGEKQVGLNLTTYLLPENIKNSGYKMTSDGAGFGGVSSYIRAFVDTNKNQKYDTGEQVLKNIIFKDIKRNIRIESDWQGQAVLRNLTPYISNPITVDIGSVEDISLIPTNKTISVVANSGQIGMIDYPFIRVGEISGSLSSMNQDLLLSDYQIHLTEVDTGKTIAQGISEFDGYFLFSNVPTGKYNIKVDLGEEQLWTWPGLVEVSEDNLHPEEVDIPFLGAQSETIAPSPVMIPIEPDESIPLPADALELLNKPAK